MHTDPNCIFCKIAAGQIPAKKIYEDDELIAFHDIHPAAPIHFMIVPKEHIESLAETHAMHEQVLGRIMVLAPRLAKEQGARPGQEGGFRVVINSGRDGGQEVFHLHVHVLAGPRPWNRMA